MTELIIAMAVAVFLTTGLIAGAFSYGLRCGKAMQGDIPKLVEKPEGRVEEVPMGNPYD
jgi:hypothetical protein